MYFLNAFSPALCMYRYMNKVRTFWCVFSKCCTTYSGIVADTCSFTES